MDHGIVRIFVTERGKRYTHHECERRLEAAVHAMMRWFHRSIKTRTTWNEADMNAAEVRDLRRVLDELQEYAEAVQQELDRIEGVNHKAERIAALRNVTGRTPEEAAAFLAKAAALEAGR